MKVTGIIHQQICQLKWHLLACLGLIMVLPVEEAMVSFREGDGFFSDSMAFTALLFGPLLAGLIACANVQGDLDEKRYIFWRSKPANIKFLISLKFFIGLVASLLVMACPLVFHLITNKIWNEGGIEKGFFKYYVPAPILISIMTYSLCFTCNVLVRKTARAWLIGMLAGGLLLVLPFLLPLDFKDYMDVIFWSRGAFLAILLIVPAAAFVLAIYAAKQDWHLRTNLKVLLWVIAGLVFFLLMLFSSQVANIKVLDEKEVEYTEEWPSIENVGEKLIFKGQSYIDIDKNTISLSNINNNRNYGLAYLPPRRIDGYILRKYPHHGILIKNNGNNSYRLIIHAYYRKEEEGASVKTFYEKVYLRSYEYIEENWKLVSELDISDCLTNYTSGIRKAMRLIDNILFVSLNNSYVLVDATNPGELKLISQKSNILKTYRPFIYNDRTKEFSIPLVPIEEIGLQERIRLSIDLNYNSYYEDSPIYKSSIVDVHDDKFAFAFFEHDEVAPYDVTHWDDDNIYCRFSRARPFTILETITGPSTFGSTIVKNGKFYCYDDHSLMVFDIRSKRGIRKLGHFVRMKYRIEDIGVLEDGNIVLCMRLDQEQGLNAHNQHKWYLNLLKNPE